MMIFDYQIYFMAKMSVNEVVTENEDGSYTIFVNDDLCDQKKLDAINHAFRHIRDKDFGNNDVQNIEYGAHA